MKINCTIFKLISAVTENQDEVVELIEFLTKNDYLRYYKIIITLNVKLLGCSEYIVKLSAIEDNVPLNIVFALVKKLEEINK